MTYTYTPGLTFSSGEDATAAKTNDLLQNVVAIFPIGALVYFHQSPTTTETTLNGKWIQCNGAVISRTTYAALWAQFGSSDVYGGGDGSTTFGLPDLRGRMPVAIGSHADVSAFGNNEGAAIGSRRMKHKHSFSVGGAHGHTGSASINSTSNSHQHLFNTGWSAVGSCTSGGVDTNEWDTTIVTTASGSADHGHTLTLSINSGNAVSLVGVNSSPSEQPAYICAGCWYMAYV